MADDLFFDTRGRPQALIGWKVEVFDRISSTNDEAMRRGQQGEKEGLVIIAEAQEKGRGRLGRIWESRPGVNLLMSVLLRPEVSPEQAPMITLLSAVAAARAIEKLTGLKPRIKWPNDLELSGKKVCGILTEMKAAAGRLEFVVVGFGLNVNSAIEDFPPELRDRATSIFLELGKRTQRAGLALALFEELEKSYRDFLLGEKEAIFSAWHERARMRGEDVKVMLDGRALEGRVRDLDEHGALLIENNEGLHRILAGDVMWARRA